jgi:pilus assembly protein FimV
MTRKLALVLAACLGLWHGAAHALGLGEISVQSALNQPFAAEIGLRNTENLERNEILANLATSEDFERVGVERFFFLSDLSFETDLSDPGNPVIRVSSRQPMTEPFVNLVVEVLWPSGRLLKEYTVLLDPPTYAARPLAAPQAPTASSAPAAAAPRRPTPAPAPERATGRGVLVGGTYGVTDRNDTLWEIAMQVRPDESLSVHQTMLALLRLNPEAFIGGNINQLKAGYVLRVPNRDEIGRLAIQDAIVQVAEQNDRWRAGLDRAPLDARQAVAEARAPSGDGGQLRLVSGTEDASATGARRNDTQAPRTGTGATGGAVAADDSAARAELASTRTQLQAAQQQNATLRTELQGTAADVAELERQLELKNQEIAQLQQAVAQQLESQRAAPPPAAPAPSVPAAAGGLFGFSWVMIGGAVGGALLLGVIVLLVLRRLSGGSSEDDFGAFSDEEVQAELEETQMMPALTAADIAAADGASVSEDEGEDVIAEADVYMAYGNFSEAAAALSSAVEADPNRADIRLKLLEVYVEQGDADAFNEHAFALQGFADEATIAEVDRLAARLPGAATSSGEIIEGEAAPARDSGDGVSLDFDLAEEDSGEDEADLDSLDIDLDLGEGGDGDGAGLDFDLDLDGDADDAEADELEADDFELSLEGDDVDEGDDGALPEIDFDLDGDDDAEAPAGAVEEELSLELEGDADTDEDGGLDADLDFEIDSLDDDDGDALAGVTSETAEDFADRTVIMGGDDLESALEDIAGDEDDDFDFDIDDLAEDDAPAAVPAAEAELDLALDGDLGDGLEDALEELAEASTEEDDATVLVAEDEAGMDADLDFELDEEFDFSDEADADEMTTKLELARAYVDMGDEEGAR